MMQRGTRPLGSAFRHVRPAALLARRAVHFTPMFPPPPPPPKSHKLRNTLLTLTGLTGLGYAWLYFQGTGMGDYPPDVFEHIRDGLTAEMLKDYPYALKSYILALNAADKSDLHNLSDEYTTIQLKVADLYARLGFDDEARLMYREMSTAYIQALASDSVPDDLRPHLIQRGLRVAIKTAYFESGSNAEEAKMSLLVYFLMAQDEVCKRSPEMAKLIKRNGSTSRLRPYMPPPRTETDAVSITPTYHDAWMPFRDELFYARDLFVGLCIATGDLPLALSTQIASTEWMTATGHPTGTALMSFYNVGAIFFLQSERLGNNSTNVSLTNAGLCFDMLVEVIEGLPAHARRDGCVDDVRALAAYGRGVVATRRGQYDAASTLLREARLRAKGCSYIDLVENSEVELKKLDFLVTRREQRQQEKDRQEEKTQKERQEDKENEQAREDAHKPIAPPLKSAFAPKEEKTDTDVGL